MENIKCARDERNDIDDFIDAKLGFASSAKEIIDIIKKHPRHLEPFETNQYIIDALRKCSDNELLKYKKMFINLFLKNINDTFAGIAETRIWEEQGRDTGGGWAYEPYYETLEATYYFCKKYALLDDILNHTENVNIIKFKEQVQQYQNNLEDLEKTYGEEKRPTATEYLKKITTSKYYVQSEKNRYILELLSIFLEEEPSLFQEKTNNLLKHLFL